MYLDSATGPRENIQVLAPDLGVRDFRAVVELFGPGDCLIFNDSATLPASLRGQGFELRLVSTLPFRAVVFGEGDWHEDTDTRPTVRVQPGQVFAFPGLAATVVQVLHPRLVEIEFDLSGDDLIAALYRIGRPIQYRHVHQDLPLWAVQTPWATKPWALETPSAGRSITLEMLEQLRSRGVAIATLTEGAGISATGSPELDKSLPFPERYDVPISTWEIVKKSLRVVAVGTSVVRALESAARGELSGVTDLRLGPDSQLLAVDGLITGLHEPGTSHRDLLSAFVDEAAVSAGFVRAKNHGLLGHEFGDVQLIWRRGGEMRD